MQDLEYILIVFAGKKHCGKTTKALEIAEARGCPIIVLNKGFHPRYANWQSITIDGIKKFNGDKCVVQVDSETIDDACVELMKYQRNCFVIFEDAYRYIPQNISRGGMRDIVSDLRKFGFDLIFMYHCLKFVPPYIASMYDALVLFKTTDTFKTSVIDKFPNDETIKQRGLRIKAHKNPHYCEMILDNE